MLLSSNQKDYGESIMADKDFERFIEIMNTRLGMKHRSKPYDLTSADELKQALTLSVGAYRDYWHYSNRIVRILEDFDESVENYETDTWFYMTQAPEKADELTVECYALLKETDLAFSRVEERAKTNLVLGLKYALSTTPDIQTTVFGTSFNIAPDEFDMKIDDLFDTFNEVEYSYAISDSFNSLVEHMKYEWADLIIN